MSATPILDFEQPAPEPIPRWRRTPIALAIGLALGMVLILGDVARLHNWPIPTFGGLLMIPSLYAGIVVHELGHLAAAKLVGTDAGGIGLGPLVAIRSGKKWVVRFEKRLFLGGFFKPLTGAAGNKLSSYAWMVAGGPIASLAFALACGVVAMQADDPRLWIGTLSWASFLLFLLAIAPYSSGLGKSDGARLWTIVIHPEQARRWLAILAIQSEEAKGVRPREWNTEMFLQMIEVKPSASEYLYCQLLAFYRRLDEGLEPAALEHLENALASGARASKPLRQALFLEAAFASSAIRHNASQARRWREAACKLRRPESTAAVDASIAMSEGRHQEAVAHWRQAKERVTQKRLDSGLIRFAMERWTAYELACEQREL